MPPQIGDGLGTNLQDPGGNVTGVTTFDPQQATTQFGFLSRRIGRYPLATALIIAASLAQIGEFSFILAELGIPDRRQLSAGLSL